MNQELKDKLQLWFGGRPGAWVLSDGQFGSTGKGVIAGALAECFADKIDIVMSNAGPNSGHTSFYGDEKIILKQLPSFAVVAGKLFDPNGVGFAPRIHLTGGAVIDPVLLRKEMLEHGWDSVTVHPNAAVIDPLTKQADQSTVQKIASTGQGVGPAMMQKMMRDPDVRSVMKQYDWSDEDWIIERPLIRDVQEAAIFFEVSQGYSLGINSGFWPHVTSRECTVSQALADAGLSPSFFRGSILSLRTFPIRVGNTENSSGPCYPDQMETDWSKLGVEPEYTTVTKRVRRVFTWSDIQFKEAVWANTPDVLFLNFVNYLKPGDEEMFVWDHVIKPYVEVMSQMPRAILLGYGPKSSDIKVWKS